MTVSTVVDHNDYVGNGVTTSFPYTFRIFDKSDLVVTVIDLSENLTVLAVDTDYTVTNVGGYAGGNVVLTAPLVTGWEISIARELEPTQETDLRNQGKFFAEVHEDAFDKLTMLIQQAFSVFRLSLRKPSSIANWYDALNNYIRNLRDPSQPQDAATKNYVDSLSTTNLNRTLRVPEAFIPVLPDASMRANKIQGYDSSGNPIMLVPQSGSAADVLLLLASDVGASYVHMKPSGVTGAVNRALTEVVYDQIIDVKWFGAVGDWNMGTQSGADDTVAIQAAINYYATLGSRRTGGRRAIKFPIGHYRYSSLTIPASVDFGLDLIGDGQMTTYLWADQSNTSPAFDCKVEFVNFRDMTLMGSLSDQNKGNSSLWKQIGFKGQLAGNGSDIDIKFDNCGLYFWQDHSQIYGRGCVYENCSIGFVLGVMNIVASPDTNFTSGDFLNSPQTGMRHYTFRNCRFDVVGRVMKITGSGVQKDHINDILITGCDFSQTNILIEGTDATIRRANIEGNNAVASFATGVVQVKSSASCQMSNNNWANEFNDQVLPDADADCIRSLWTTTGGANGLLIQGNIVRNLSGNAVTAGTASSDVCISGNYFPQAWTFSTGTNHFVFYSPVNCDGLRIINNGFQTSSISGSYFMYDASVQNSRKTRVLGNTATWNWQDYRLRYTPRMLFNGTATVSTMTAQGRYEVTDGKVIVDVMISGTPSETTGNISISLPPVSAVVENATISPSFSGGGTVIRVTNIAAAGASMAPIQVNPSTQEAELWKATNMTLSRITAADKSGAVAVLCKFEYVY